MRTKNIILISVLALAGFGGAYLISSHTGFPGSFFHNNWYSHGYYGGHMMGGGIMHFIFWLVLFFFLISAFGGRKSTVAATTDSAVEVLKKKYVNGDIGKAEFTDKMNHLNE